MTSIHTDETLRKYFSPDSYGRILAYHRNDLSKEGRRELVEALIDYYLAHEAERERAG